jgi:hypothetical protein
VLESASPICQNGLGNDAGRRAAAILFFAARRRLLKSSPEGQSGQKAVDRTKGKLPLAVYVGLLLYAFAGGIALGVAALLVRRRPGKVSETAAAGHNQPILSAVP